MCQYERVKGGESMKKVCSLNDSLAMDNCDLNVMIEEMASREEFSCTGNSCPAHSCGIVWIEENGIKPMR